MSPDAEAEMDAILRQAGFAPTQTAEWIKRCEFIGGAMRCPDCHVAVELTFLSGYQVRISHPLPSCPGFAQWLENLNDPEGG